MNRANCGDIAKQQKGLAALEAALGLVVLAVFVIGVIGLTAYVQQRRFVTQAVDKFIYQSNLSPLLLDELNTLTLNHQSLSDFVTDAVNKLEREIQERAAARSYFIEGVYGAVEVDPSTGRVTRGPEVFKSCERGASGFVSRELMEKTSLTRRMQKKMQEQQPDGSFLYAGLNPLSSFQPQLSETYGKYLPFSVFVGLRAFLDAKGSAALSGLGYEPVPFATKLVLLRSDVDLR